MNKDKKIITLFILCLSGLMFSGYMSSIKLFTNTCAFNEPCPYFFGIPACYIGFGLFLALFVLGTALLLNNLSIKKGIKLILLFSSLGIIYAGYFSLIEIPTFFDLGFKAYVFGLPTCALGLLFFVLIYIVAFIKFKHIKK
jgi:hypothetical protein